MDNVTICNRYHLILSNNYRIVNVQSLNFHIKLTSTIAILSYSIILILPSTI